jgi:hypothetical protein
MLGGLTAASKAAVQRTQRGHFSQSTNTRAATLGMTTATSAKYSGFILPYHLSLNLPEHKRFHAVSCSSKWVLNDLYTQAVPRHQYRPEALPLSREQLPTSEIANSFFCPEHKTPPPEQVAPNLPQ